MSGIMEQLLDSENVGVAVDILFCFYPLYIQRYTGGYGKI